MADEFINWLDTSNSRTGFNNNNNNSSSASISSSGNNSSMLLFQDTRDKLLLQTIDPSSRGVLMDHSVQVMAGLGLSSQPNQDWNQSLLNGKPDAGFGCILEEENQLGLNVNYQPESVTRQNFQQWRTQPKIFSAGGVDESCSNQRLPITNTNNFQVDNNFSFYENNSSSPSTMLQGFLGPSFENNHQRSIDYNYPSYASNYDMSNHSDVLMLPKFSHHLMPSTTSSSPPIQMVTPQSQLHFSNDAPFWNASATTTTTSSTTTTMSDHVSSSYLPNSLHRQQMSMSPDFDQKNFKTNASEKSSNSSSGAMKKSTNSEVSLKRPRNETSSSTPLPAFKVRKEKMGDRITALQQLVSPFGKTDTASVLSEAIEYIKFLHEQVAVLSTPYMKNGASIQQQQHHQGRRDKNKDMDGTKQDLRSRGLCLVPISSTFPMTHETSVDFWTPTFGGTFR